jgi:hypothetical protein
MFNNRHHRTGENELGGEVAGGVLFLLAISGEKDLRKAEEHRH